jgi:hypothetical protein
MTRLYLPGLHGQEPTMVCRVPIGNGETCGKQFYPGEERAWQRHMTACAAEHEAAIHAESLKTRMPVFDENNWDPEYVAAVLEWKTRTDARPAREPVTAPRASIVDDIHEEPVETEPLPEISDDQLTIDPETDPEREPEEDLSSIPVEMR